MVKHFVKQGLRRSRQQANLRTYFLCLFLSNTAKIQIHPTSGAEPGRPVTADEVDIQIENTSNTTSQVTVTWCT